MKTQIRFLANEINISPRKWPFIILIITGMALSFLSLVMIFGYINTYYPVERLLFGTGIIIFASGLFCLLSRHNVIISINSSRGIIEIKNIYIFKRVVAAFPVIHFSRINIFEHLSITRGHAVKTGYQVSLESNTHTSLLLFEFPVKEKAFEFAHKLQELILLDIFYQEKMYKKSDFKLKVSNVPDDIRLSPFTRIRKIQKESEIVLKWNSNCNFLSFLLFAAILYGFYYIIAFVIIHEDGLNLESVIGYSVFGITAFAAIMIFLTNCCFKIKTVRLDKENIKYYTRIFGIKTGCVQVNWDDVRRIQNAINAPLLYVINKTADDIIQEIMEIPAGKEALQLKKDLPGRLNALEKAQLKIDTRDLPVSDRICLEQEMHNFML